MTSVVRRTSRVNPSTVNGVEHFILATRVFTGAHHQQARLRNRLKAVGEVVYVIRFDDVIKIGWTRNLAERLTRLGVRRSEMERLLVVMPGTESLEHELHIKFRRSLARGKEYFHPTPDLIEWINEKRDAMGVAPLEVN